MFLQRVAVVVTSLLAYSLLALRIPCSNRRTLLKEKLFAVTANLKRDQEFDWINLIAQLSRVSVNYFSDG